MLSRLNSRSFHRRIFRNQISFAGFNGIQLLKRGPDQQAGTVTAYRLYQCWRTNISRSGEPYVGDMTSSDRTTWAIPRTELLRVGIDYISALDRIVDVRNNYWQPESTETISTNLFADFILLDCQRCDPANNAIKPYI